MLSTPEPPSDAATRCGRRSQLGWQPTVTVRADGGADVAGIERWFVARGLPHFVERH